MNWDIVQYILLQLPTAKEYYRVAGSLCRRTRNARDVYVHVKHVTCCFFKCEPSKIITSVVWRGDTHPHDIVISLPFILEHGMGIYKIQGEYYERRMVYGWQLSLSNDQCYTIFKSTLRIISGFEFVLFDEHDAIVPIDVPQEQDWEEKYASRNSKKIN